MKNYITFVNEAAKRRFKVGDLVFCTDNIDDLDCKDQFGIITEINYNEDGNEDDCVIKFSERFDDQLHNGNGDDDTDSSWYMTTDVLKKLSNKSIEKYKLKMKRELDKKKKLCKRYKDIDPYAEEDWTEEDKERKKLKKLKFDI